MNHEQLIAEAKESSMGRWEKHRFLLMVGATISTALVLVVVSMWLYHSSGAAQLDLSRPGYVSVREKVDSASNFKDFPSTGAIDDQVLKQFRELYTDQAEKATGVDSFGGTVMSDEALLLTKPD